jgi:hypothetical protein
MKPRAVDSSVVTLKRLVQAGDLPAARRLLTDLASRKLPRELWCELAYLARQSQIPLLALRLLGPAVRPRGTRVAVATEREKAEYATCLDVIGANHEAIALLKSIDTATCPIALLYHSIALFRRWVYDEPIELLRKYLNSPGPFPIATISSAP